MLTLAAAVSLSGVAFAQGGQGEILISKDISVSTTWTSNNVYNLQKQIYVLPGASLTIQAGTVIASDTGKGGSLAVARGAQIFVKGTATQPVIFTSKADKATWKNNDPKTGKWREAANEWGNLTLMGRAYISEDGVSGNKPVPNASNIGAMEGLVAAFPGDPKVLYGGGKDNDDSGTISFVSIRYGGKVVSLNNELNGLSLGGIGRGTDIHHVEIMNNVDDGVEIWGGTVNLKYFSIWNVGDDSFDIDQGWRGRAQFGLLVQGYSLNAKQGSGVGDNAFETDGAENSDWQPVTTASIYNFTVIGQPFDGDGLTAWRDNARVQYHNCIFMDGGEKVVRFDNIDGDGGKGYGFNGTLSWPATWTTSYKVTSKVNAPKNPSAFYTVQRSGMLAEIKDSIFFNNKNRSAYTEATARGVFASGNNNVKEPRGRSPITKIIRGRAVVKGGKVMAPVVFLDPRPANDALTSASWAPASDPFFSSAHYRGGFAPGNNWLTGWTAAYAYGFLPKSPWTDLGNALAGPTGDPILSPTGTLAPNSPLQLAIQNAPKSSASFLILSPKKMELPFFGGVMVPDFTVGVVIPAGLTDSSGKLNINATWPSGVSQGTTLYWQAWILNSSNSQFASTNGVLGVTP